MTLTPMFVLAVLLIFALAATAYLVFRDWRSSRTTTKQVPPEVATRRWLNREARNARQDGKAPSRRPFGS